MISLLKELKYKVPELKDFLKISLTLRKELAGAYLNTNQLEIFSDLKFGDHNSVYNIETFNESSVPFHTHVVSNSPPSGNDVVALLYRILKQQSEYSIVIESSAIYVFTPRILLMGEIAKMVAVDSEQIDSWKMKFIKKIDQIAIEFNISKDYQSYIKNMHDDGVEVHIIEL